MELEALLLGPEGLERVKSKGRKERKDTRLKNPQSSICHGELEHAIG